MPVTGTSSVAQIMKAWTHALSSTSSSWAAVNLPGQGRLGGLQSLWVPVEYCQLFFPWRIRGSCWNQNGEQTRLLKCRNYKGETEAGQRAGLRSARLFSLQPFWLFCGCPAGHCLIYSIGKNQGPLEVRSKNSTLRFGTSLFEKMVTWLSKFGCDLFFSVFFKCSIPLSVWLSVFQILSIVSIKWKNVPGASEFG